MLGLPTFHIDAVIKTPVRLFGEMNMSGGPTVSRNLVGASDIGATLDGPFPTVGNGPSSVAPISEAPTKFLLTVGPPDIFISPNSLTGVLITASIWNVGKPSIATQWSLTVIPRNGLVPVTRDSIPINPAGLRVWGG